MRRARRAVLVRLFVLLLAVVLIFAAIRTAATTLYPKKYSDYVEQYCVQYKVPRDLVYSVIKNESNFRPNAVSSIGARGLMQITDETFEWAKWRMKDEDTEYQDLFDPETNIKYGTYILSMLLDEFKSYETALAAYHAGWGSVKRWLSDDKFSSDGQNIDAIPFLDTAKYVPKVMKTCEIYNKIYKNKL